MHKNIKISDLIQVPPVQTVIRLEESRTDPRGIAGSFVFTDEVTSHFTVIADAILSSRGQGYFLLGDFGSGKSHFLAALSAWLAGGPGADMLIKGHKGLQKVQTTAGRLLPVNVSLVKYRATTSLEQIIILAIDDMLLSLGFEETVTPIANFISHLQGLLEDSYLLGRFAALVELQEKEVIPWIEANHREAFKQGIRLLGENGVEASEILFGERYETLGRALAVIKSMGYAGLFLIIDELSEFFRSKPTAPLLNEDARTLQLLGELSQTQPVWIITALQESIEKTGDIAQATLRKIKDRYPVKLHLSTVHIRSLVAGRLVIHKEGADEQIHLVHQEYKNQFAGFIAAFDSFREIYPIHPETIRLLDGLSDLFSQHRGIVDFVYSRIAGNKEKNIPGILDNNIMELLGPDSIYDHFQSRIAEFSSFNQYPRQILPHFKEVITRVLDNEKDRELALRLIKILILYAIHPTESPPNTGKLTELVALTLFLQKPEMNIRFISEALLDKIAEHSRFLVKEKREDPAQCVYRITAEGDPGKVLDSHLAQALKETAENDTRILTDPLQELTPSISWPGPAFMTTGLERSVDWLGSVRKSFIRFLWGDELQYIEQLSYQVTEGKYDFAMICLLGNEKKSANWPENVALWRITVNEPQKKKLREYFALNTIQSSLNPANPADAQIIDRVKEKLDRMQPEALQIALETFYSGEFIHPAVEINQAIRQIKKFDRLLEKAGSALLEARYPSYKNIMPRRTEANLHKYRRLLEIFIYPGSISFKEARDTGTTESIEGIALPLGLVEQKGSSYIFSPSITKHHFLVYFFSLIKPSGQTPVLQLYETARLGEYGVTEDIFNFLLVCLAHAGLIALLKGGRSIPLELINLHTVRGATHLAPGEMISRNDQQILFSECGFLLPAEAHEAFGLRQQRDVWKNVIQFKNKAERLLAGIERGLQQYAGYAAFQVFDNEDNRTRLKALKTVIGEIKTSYSARDGLERFLGAFRGSGLQGEDITYLRKLNRFFQDYADKYNFLYHYIHHKEADKSCSLDEGINRRREKILALLDDPNVSIIMGEGELADSLFQDFKEQYISFYTRMHNAYYKSLTRPVLSRDMQKGYAVLKRLSRIESLDRPGGLLDFFTVFEKPLPACRSRVLEELQRNPVCSCGFQVDTEPFQPQEVDPGKSIGTFLNQYLEILREPRIKQAVTARAYALRHAEPQAAANLDNLVRSLDTAKQAPASLLDLFDDTTVSRLADALQGNITIKNRQLAGLVKTLAGRRLTPVQISDLVKKWIACPDSNTLISIENTGPAESSSIPVDVSWWPRLHGEMTEITGNRQDQTLDRLQQALEKQYPAAGLKEIFYRMHTPPLLAFITNERFYFDAIHQALLIFAERLVKGAVTWPEPKEPVRSLFLDRKKSKLITRYLTILQNTSRLTGAPFPALLGMRLLYEELYFNPLTTRELQQQLLMEIDKLVAAGEHWLRTLPPVPVIDLADNPLVMIVDGVPADVWLNLLPETTWTESPCRSSWHALEVKPLTAEALAALFGTGGDPMEFFAANSIEYESLEGNEEAAFSNILAGSRQDRPLVVRLALVDRQAHAGSLRLSEMTGLLLALRDTAIKQAIHFCRDRGRPLFLTTDHGLSFTARGYSHGRGGVFERAIPVFRWPGTG